MRPSNSSAAADFGSSLSALAARVSASPMRQASNKSSPVLNGGSASAAKSRAASKTNSKKNRETRYFKRRSLGKIFEVALDLLFHLRRHALLERVEDFLAEVSRRSIFILARQAEFFRVQTGEALFDVKVGKLRHARQRRQRTVG